MSDLQAAIRVMDVNANRAAEGLRTLEEVARLIREDENVAGWLKALRHELQQTVERGIRRSLLLDARCTATDAGTENHTSSENNKASWREIVPAASERVGQALRCLEEFAKAANCSNVAEFKTLRYKCYDQLARIEQRLLDDQWLSLAGLYLLIDCSRSVEDFVAYVRSLAEAGVDVFQLRDKQAEGGTLFRFGQALVQGLKGTNARAIINDRVDIALAVGAAGVHLGQDDVTIHDARRLTGSRLVIGISTHNLAQAESASRSGADYIGCGPTFPSRTKHFDSFPGLPFLRQIAHAELGLPAFALGGISLENLPQVLESGVSRIAVTAAIHQAEDAIIAARELKAYLRSNAM
ncbi:MAG: thiamine phosphate synthase [Planctomycetales bacterium]|nr:thiamine phosphate synthase [Planctomycetales bacterium]